MAIRAWHIQQAAATATPVAMLNFQVTAGGRVESTCLGMEPAMAQALLTELDEARARLEGFIAEANAGQRCAEIRPLRRRA